MPVLVHGRRIAGAVFASPSRELAPHPALLLPGNSQPGRQLGHLPLFVTAFLVWFPVPLNRNVVLYSLVYALYFIAGTLAELAASLGGLAMWGAVNLTVNCVDLTCLALWIVFLNRSGETTTVVFSHTWTPQREDHLMRQLEAINTSLMRSAAE